MKFALPIITALLIIVKADNTPSVRVLCYHSFRDAKNTYNFTIDELRDQINFLKSRGFTFISAQDILAGKVKGDKNILITIDDGNASVYRAYKEIFKPNGIRPLLAIYPNVIGKKSYALTWEQLAELVKDGCDVGAHGYYHNILSAKNFEKDSKAFIREIAQPKKILEEKLGRRVNFFIYPFGAYSEDARRIVKESGYKLAFTIKPGILSLPINGDSFILPRYMLTQGTSKWQMHAITGSLPKKGEGGHEKTTPVLAVKLVRDAGKVKSTTGTAAKEKMLQPDRKKGPIVVVDRLHTPKKQKDAPQIESKGEKDRKKAQKRHGEKEVAVNLEIAEPIGKADTADQQKDTNKSRKNTEDKDKGDLFYPEIGTIAPAWGDALLEDSFSAKASRIAPENMATGLRAAAMNHVSKDTSDRSLLRKEYMTLAVDSYQSYVRIINRFVVKMQDLRNMFLRLVTR